MIRVLFAAVSFAQAAWAWAGEESFKLKPGSGADRVAAACVTCHSLDYIAMNSPFLDRKGWEGVVNKMIQKMGAPISQNEVPVIVEYLERNYGPKETATTTQQSQKVK